MRRDGFENSGDFDSEFRGMQRFEPISRSHEGLVDVLEIGRHDDEGWFYYVIKLADGWLTVRDVHTLSLRTMTLAVLGACWSGDTAMLPGREMIGLPVAMLDTGARTVIAAQWELFDTAADGEPEGSPTAAFASEFYAALREHGPVTALAQVQARWARTRPVSDWAGYQAFVRGLPPRAGLRWLLAARQWLRRATAAPTLEPRRAV